MYVGQLLRSEYIRALVDGDPNPGSDVELIRALDDLPPAVNGVITLEAETVYYFEGHVDLLGSRLVGQFNTCLLGASSENAFITSTGLAPGQALFSTDFTTPIRHLTFRDVHTCLDIDGSRSGQTPALDWTGVNFVSCPNVGQVRNMDNLIISKSAFLNSVGLVLGGTFGTVGFDNCIFNSDGNIGTIITVGADAVVTRRMRLTYSSMIVTAGNTGIDFSVAATVPVESYILDTINFSGAGTYVTGVPYFDNRARFVGVRGVGNSAELANYYMSGNAVPTDITNPSVPEKVAGVTTANVINQRFAHSNNRATYIGALTRFFEVTATASFTSGNNQVIGLYVFKNGQPVVDSEMYATTNGLGRAESVAIHTVLELATTDYVEIWVENANSSNDVTVEYLNCIVKSIGA